MDFEVVYKKMKEGNDDDALRMLSKKLMQECINLIKSRTIFKDHYEATSIYYHAYLYVKCRINEDKFSFMGDDAFRSFFKTACMHQAREIMREQAGPDYIPPYDEFIDEYDDTQEIYTEIQSAEYQRKLDMYGIDLKSVEAQEDRLPMVVNAFHSLSEKCKFLILLKYFINLSHHDIVETLYNFYEIKNEDVSKAELSRCLKYIRIKIENQKPLIQN